MFTSLLCCAGNLTTKSREAEGSDGGPDSKRGLAKHNSASHEELDRVGYPKDSDKKRLSSLFDSFKSSKDESEEPIQVRHVSCRRRRDSDSESDSGSSIEGESPMEVGDSKTHSSDHLSSAQSASLAQNLSETESTSDMLREKRLSAEISEDVQVPSEEHDQNGGQSSEEMSRQSPEVIPMMPTETVITVKRRSGEPEYLPTLEESVECPVSTARNSSQVSEPRSNIVRRTSSEKSDSSMSSARTASPATKMRLLDLASKRALERESFDQEESGNESPKHKDDSLSNGLSQAKRTPINGPSARPNSPQPETCSESEVEDFEVAEFPLYASPEEVQELQSSADEAVDTVLEVKLQQIRDLPIQAEDWEIPVENKDNVNSHQTQKLAYRRANTSLHQTPEKVSQQTKDSADRYIKNRVHLKNDNENSKFVQGAHAAPILQKERGKNHNRHEEADFENEDILETKSEPSTVYHDLMDDAPERTSTPKNKIETIDDDTLFKLLSSVPLSSNTSESLEPPKRRGSKDDSDIQLRSTSQSSTTAASSAATMINLSQIGMPVDNGEGDPFATESADVREAMQRYLEQEEEMSDCLSVITERTEPEDDDYDDVSEISKGLDETVEDEELDKEIEKIYQANLHIDSYLSSESFRSGTVSSAIRKSRKGLQKKHIEEVLSSPISHDLPAISESEPESTDTEDKAMREGKEVETHDKFSTVSDTISAYLSDMSSVDNSNIQTPASSEPVSDEDDKSEQAATASDEQDSAWFDMSMSVDSVKEVLTARGSGLQKEELKASLSSETLCDEDLPRDDEEEVDTNTNRNRESQADENKNDGNVADSQAEEEMSTNQIVKSQFDNQNGNDVEEQNVYIGNVKEQNFALESENASTPFPLPMHVADDVTSTSDKILSSSLVTSLPDLDSQAQSTTLTSTFAASPAESSSDIRPQVKVTGDGMSDETGSHGGDSGHISGNSAENTPEHRGSRSPRHSHLSIPSLALTSTSAEEQASQEEDEDIDEMVATHKSVGSLRGSYGNLTSSLALGSKLSSDSRESLYSVYSDAGEINYGKIPVTGEILFGLDYNYKTGALEIFIKQCRDIAPVDTKHNKSDPYVKTYLLPDRTRSGKRKTKIKKHTLNPTFDEVLKYVISKSEVENRALWVTVWNHDRFGRNDFLGEVMIGLDCYKFGDSTPIWYPLQERLEAPGSAPVSYKGDLVLSVKYVTAENIESKETTKKGKSKKVKGTSRGELQVLIKEARNLTAVRSNGASDPFCKAYLLPEKHKSSKQKTPVIKRNCNPTWNHVFLFEDIEITELKDRSLELTVWDYDKITSNDFLGGIRLNLGTGVAGGRNAEWMDGRGEEIALWQSVMDRPNCWNDATIGLRASMGKSEIRK